MAKTNRKSHADFADILPARYSEYWFDPFQREVADRLRPGMTILDIGGGRRPWLAPDQRPEDTTYVGLDPDGGEFEAAPPGVYDREIVADAVQHIPDLAGTVDLALSWQVFEHVSSLEAVLRNARDYLKPGGTLVSQFSGRWAAYAVVNRLLVDRVAAAVATTVGRRGTLGTPVFSARYDSCTYSEVRRLTRDWGQAEITPFYRGALYFRFARPLMRVYVVYEDVVRRAGWANTATHYLLVATR
jgi:SAM-dependent methyltransferase